MPSREEDCGPPQVTWIEKGPSLGPKLCTFLGSHQGQNHGVLLGEAVSGPQLLMETVPMSPHEGQGLETGYPPGGSGQSQFEDDAS